MRRFLYAANAHPLSAPPTRPATIRAYEKGAAVNTVPTITKESTALLLGLTGGNASDTGDRKAA